MLLQIPPKKLKPNINFGVPACPYGYARRLGDKDNSLDFFFVIMLKNPKKP